MGWDSNYNWFTKSDVVNDLNKISPPNKLIASHSTHGILWQVVEIVQPSGKIVNIIVCNLIEKRDGKFWVKTLDESSHPYYYSCPMNFLALAPIQSKEWREKVINYWVANKTKYKVGSKVILTNGWKLEIIGTNPLSGMRIDSSEKVAYRIPKKFIVSEIHEE